MIWIACSILLSYIIYLMVNLFKEARLSRRESRRQEKRISRQIEILETASWASRYSLPCAERDERAVAVVVEDLDRHRGESLNA